MAKRLTDEELWEIYWGHRERPSTRSWCRECRENWPCAIERLRRHIDALEQGLTDQVAGESSAYLVHGKDGTYWRKTYCCVRKHVWVCVAGVLEMNSLCDCGQQVYKETVQPEAKETK